MKKTIAENGFADKKEFYKLMTDVKLTKTKKGTASKAKMKRFKEWQANDGSKVGLLKVIELNK